MGGCFVGRAGQTSDHLVGNGGEQGGHTGTVRLLVKAQGAIHGRAEGRVDRCVASAVHLAVLGHDEGIGHQIALDEAQ